MGVTIARLALLAAIVAAVAVAATGPAYRAGVDLMTVFFVMFPTGVYAAMAAGGLAVVWLIVALVQRSAAGWMLVVAALVIAAAAASFPIGMRAAGQSVPPIHDITTDTANPPVFVAIAPLRADAPNGVDYKADENVEPTKQAYPDLAPLITEVPPRDMFTRAEKVARDMGWEIVAAQADEGRLEATDTTMWFGFKDDIVVRIVAEGQGSRLDVRSMSRVGKSDLGKNAERIRKFLAAVKEAS
jgi:uncharacterized protein (DUF1499 family)